jgi:hypothetical protein
MIFLPSVTCLISYLSKSCRGFSSSLSDTDKSIAIPFLAYTIFNALQIICIKLNVVSSTTTTTVMSGRGPLKFSREPFLSYLHPCARSPFPLFRSYICGLTFFLPYPFTIPFNFEKIKNISLSL